MNPEKKDAAAERGCSCSQIIMTFHPSLKDFVTKAFSEEDKAEEVEFTEAPLSLQVSIGPYCPPAELPEEGAPVAGGSGTASKRQTSTGSALQSEDSEESSDDDDEWKGVKRAKSMATLAEIAREALIKHQRKQIEEFEEYFAEVYEPYRQRTAMSYQQVLEEQRRFANPLYRWIEIIRQFLEHREQEPAAEHWGEEEQPLLPQRPHNCRYPSYTIQITATPTNLLEHPTEMESTQQQDEL